MSTEKTHTRTYFCYITRLEYYLSEKEAYEIIRQCIAYGLLYETKFLGVFRTKFLEFQRGQRRRVVSCLSLLDVLYLIVTTK